MSGPQAGAFAARSDGVNETRDRSDAPVDSPEPGATPERETPPAPAPAPARVPRNPMLLRALRSGRPVRGTVVGVIKGGYEVKVGRARGFCPHSQIELRREEDPERQVGQTYMFRVIQVRRGGEDVVLSRRAVLEEERLDEAKAVRATLVPGSIRQGHVVGMAEFGAFVDLGAGVRGLVHLSELAHGRTARVEDVVKLGDTVQVKVLKLDEAAGRISLSLKQALPDPWDDVATRFAAGSVHPGELRRVTDAGAVVELAPGIEALAPAGEFPPSARGFRAALEPAPTRWLVLAVDAPARRITLTLPGDPSAPAIEAGAEVEGAIQRIERYGLFVWLAPGRVGLLQREWLGIPQVAELQRRFAVGDRIPVRVLEVGDGGQRIRLARQGVEARAEPPPRAGKRREEPERPAPRPAAPQPESSGTLLGDKLRAALGRRPPKT